MLDEHYHGPDEWPMAGETKTPVEPPLVVVVEELKYGDRLLVSVERPAERPLDRRKQFRIGVLGGRSLGQEPRAPVAGRVGLDSIHQSVDVHVAHRIPCLRHTPDLPARARYRRTGGSSPSENRGSSSSRIAS